MLAPKQNHKELICGSEILFKWEHRTSALLPRGLRSSPLALLLLPRLNVDFHPSQSGHIFCDMNDMM